MSEVIALIVGCLVGAAFYRGWLIYQRMQRMKTLAMLAQDVIDEIKSKIIDASVEVHGGIFFLYNKDTKEFLLQGKDYEEIVSLIKTKFPGKHFNVTEKDLDIIKGISG